MLTALATTANMKIHVSNMTIIISFIESNEKFDNYTYNQVEIVIETAENKWMGKM